MRHRKKTVKLGRTFAHRNALLASLVCHLIRRQRIQTTLPKAKAARSLAEKMVTLAKRNSLDARRKALSVLRQSDAVGLLFTKIAPAFATRSSGYTRVLRLGRRGSDSGERALLEWVDYVPQPPKKKKEKKQAAP
jgi:large subunit ribosomal protein L17